MPLFIIYFYLALGLIDNRQCIGSEDAVQSRIVGIGDQWEFLVTKSSQKADKLKEANKQQTFHISIKDIDFWLSEVRNQNWKTR